MRESARDDERGNVKVQRGCEGRSVSVDERESGCEQARGKRRREEEAGWKGKGRVGFSLNRLLTDSRQEVSE